MIKTENMRLVAHHLQQQAMAADVEHRDAFARSAYNRYYYSVFLQSRDMMRQLDSSWSTIAHATYPQLLNGKIKTAFKAERKRALKNDDRELIKSIDQACRSIAELRKIIIKANQTRVVADYKPEEGVVFSSAERFSLRSIDVTEAHGWSSQAGTLCQTILKSWKQFNA